MFSRLRLNQDSEGGGERGRVRYPSEIKQMVLKRAGCRLQLLIQALSCFGSKEVGQFSRGTTTGPPDTTLFGRDYVANVRLVLRPQLTPLPVGLSNVQPAHVARMGKGRRKGVELLDGLERGCGIT